jgi:hypothetical protein
VHVAHVQIGGVMLNPDVIEREDDPEPSTYLDPDDVAKTCLHVVAQDTRTQTFELDLRPGANGLY